MYTCKRSITALILLISLAASTHAVDFYWNYDGTDSWGNPARWTVNGQPATLLPGLGDTVNISRGTVDGGHQLRIYSDINITGGTLLLNDPRIAEEVPGLSITVNQTGGALILTNGYLFEHHMHDRYMIYTHSGGVYESRGFILGIYNTTEIWRISGTAVAMVKEDITITATEAHQTAEFSIHGGTVTAAGFDYEVGKGNAIFEMTGGVFDIVQMDPFSGADPINPSARFTGGYSDDPEKRVRISGGAMNIDSNLQMGYGHLTLEVSGGNTNVGGDLMFGTMMYNPEYFLDGSEDGQQAYEDALDMQRKLEGPITLYVTGKANIQVAGDCNFGGYFEEALDAETQEWINAEIAQGNIMFSRSVLEIDGGTFRVQGRMFTDYEADNTLNVIGSRADISVGEFNTGDAKFTTNFYLDRLGVSTIGVDGAADVSGEMNIEMSGGFQVLQTDHVDLLKAVTLQNLSGLNVTDNTPFGLVRVEDVTEGGKDVLRYACAAETPVWDLTGAYIFNGDDGVTKTALRVEGEETWLTATFNNLEASGLADQLVEYLNATSSQSGVLFSLLSGDSLLMQGGYLGDAGYAYFGWNLTAFNEMYSGANITLRQLNQVPEPATWMLLLLGGVMIFRTVNRKKQQPGM